MRRPGFGLASLVAPRWTRQMAHSLHPLLESGILLTAVAAVLLDIFFNGAKGDEAAASEAAKHAEAHQAGVQLRQAGPLR